MFCLDQAAMFGRALSQPGNHLVGEVIDCPSAHAVGIGPRHAEKDRIVDLFAKARNRLAGSE